MLPTLIVDWKHGPWLQRMNSLYRFFGVECKTYQPSNGEACTTDMQNGSSNFEVLPDLMQTIEPNRIARDIERTVFLSRPFQNKSSGFTDNEMTSQRAMMSGRGCNLYFNIICFEGCALPGL